MSRVSALRVRSALLSVALGAGIAATVACQPTTGPTVTFPVPTPVVETDSSVCYPSPTSGEWLSDYSESGYCTFGLPLDTLPGDETEESPRFDCRVHGNRVCGPGAVLPDGTVLPDGFNYPPR